MKLKALVAAAAVTLVTATIPAEVALAGFFPADRKTFTCTTPTNCVGADYVTFNSFTNNPVVGDERPFFAGSLNGANVQDRIKVKNGDEIVLRAYVHNNADPNLIGKEAAIARNVKMKVLIPTVKQKDHNLVAFISASNSNPGTVNDTMSLYGDKEFKLEYVTGSAKFDHKQDGVNLISEKISDNVIGSNGTYLGDMHGCFQYSGYVTLRVRVVMDETPTPTPTVVCDALSASAINGNRKKLSFNAKATATNGAVINNYTYDFGDGNKVTSANTTVEHEYAKAGTYTATVVVNSTLGTTEVVQRCSVTVKITDDKPPVVVPPTTPVTPTKLPETGAAGLLGAFVGVSGLSSLGYYIFGRRFNR